MGPNSRSLSTSTNRSSADTARIWTSRLFPGGTRTDHAAAVGLRAPAIPVAVKKVPSRLPSRLASKRWISTGARRRPPKTMKPTAKARATPRRWTGHARPWHVGSSDKLAFPTHVLQATHRHVRPQSRFVTGQEFACRRDVTYTAEDPQEADGIAAAPRKCAPRRASCSAGVIGRGNCWHCTLCRIR